VLTGDSHHYARYKAFYREAGEERAYADEGCHYITAGGGGAFLHPTHTLNPDIRFDWNFPPPGVKDDGKTVYQRRFQLASKSSVFPSIEESRRLAWGNLKFPVLNWSFGLVMGAIWATFAWLLSFNAGSALSDILAKGSLLDALGSYLRLVVVSPWPVALLTIGAAGFYYFADYKAFRWRLIVGLLHGAVHFVAGTALALIVARCLGGLGGDLLLLALILAGGSVLSGFIFGVYLLISVLCFRVHANEAFSSLRIEDYKNFLRMRICADGVLTVYPVGLKSVPGDRGEPPANPVLQPHLIEGPISIA
jgi:hypothetical protein